MRCRPGRWSGAMTGERTSARRQAPRRRSAGPRPRRAERRAGSPAGTGGPASPRPGGRAAGAGPAGAPTRPADPSVDDPWHRWPALPPARRGKHDLGPATSSARRTSSRPRSQGAISRGAVRTHASWRAPSPALSVAGSIRGDHLPAFEWYLACLTRMVATTTVGSNPAMVSAETR